MTQNTFEFELVSPEEKLVSGPMAHVVIPGTEGEIGVGPNHVKFVVSLKPGVIRMHKTTMHDAPERVFIAGGFADITGESCSVLAEEAVNVNDLDQAALSQDLERLNAELSDEDDEIVQSRLTSEIALVEAKLLAA